MPSQDERRAKVIAFLDFLQDNLDTAENRGFFEKNWMEFLKQRKTQYLKPEQIAQEFECWQERNQT